MKLMEKTLQRVRHDTRLRKLAVTGVERITPRMVRVSLEGDMAGFVSLGFGDHIKVFFWAEGQEPVMPEIGPNGLAFPEGVRPEMRDYTPRHFDAEKGTLVLDFVLHGDGPASSWAAQAAVGQDLVIGGPRGSLVVPFAFDWHLLVGDETALPAIGRRIEELPKGTRAVAVIEVEDAAEEQRFESRGEVSVTYVHRNGAEAGRNTLLLDAIQAMSLPEGECYAFLAGESHAMRAIRAHLETRSFNAEWIKAAGYWLYGVADAHEPH